MILTETILFIVRVPINLNKVSYTFRGTDVGFFNDYVKRTDFAPKALDLEIQCLMGDER